MCGYEGVAELAREILRRLVLRFGTFRLVVVVVVVVVVDSGGDKC